MQDLRRQIESLPLGGSTTVGQAAKQDSRVEKALIRAVNLARDFKLKFVLNHISYSQPVLDYVASLKVPVIVGPIYEAPKDDERYDAVYSLYPLDYRADVAALQRPEGATDSIVASASLIPEALVHAFSTFGVLLTPELPLTRRQHEIIATLVSALNRCFY